MNSWPHSGQQTGFFLSSRPCSSAEVGEKSGSVIQPSLNSSKSSAGSSKSGSSSPKSSSLVDRNSYSPSSVTRPYWELMSRIFSAASFLFFASISAQGSGGTP